MKVPKKQYDLLVNTIISNIPLRNLTELSENLVQNYSKNTLGCRVALVNPYYQIISEIIYCTYHKILSTVCFDEFSLTFDDTSSFVEVEAIIIRVVAEKSEIMEVLVCCNLFQKNKCKRISQSYY